jgi:hydrogenase maturation protein HypF
VQHHHAHLASGMAENGLDGEVIGATFDGTGYGTTARSGAAILIGGYRGFRRRPISRPSRCRAASGRSASRGGWRCPACQAGEPIDLLETHRRPRSDPRPPPARPRLNAPRTSSCGRLFDAVSSLAGVRDRVTYEARPRSSSKRAPGSPRGAVPGRVRARGRPLDRPARPGDLRSRRSGAAASRRTSPAGSTRRSSKRSARPAAASATAPASTASC